MTISRVALIAATVTAAISFSGCGGGNTAAKAHAAPTKDPGQPTATSAPPKPSPKPPGACALLDPATVERITGTKDYHPDDRSRDGKLQCGYIHTNNSDSLQVTAVKDADAVVALQTLETWKSQCKQTLPLDVTGVQGILCQQGSAMIIPEAYASWANYEVEVAIGDLGDKLDPTMIKNLRDAVVDVHHNLTPQSFQQ